DLRLRVRSLCGGQWSEGSGGLVEKYAPRNGELLAQFQSADSRRVNAAVAAAREALERGPWSRFSVAQRKAVLHRLADLVEKDRETLAMLECLDVGNPISDAL